MTTMLTVAQICAAHPCDRYQTRGAEGCPTGIADPERVRLALGGVDALPLAVAMRLSEVPPDDRVWAATIRGVAPDRVLHLHAAMTAERALLRERAAGLEPAAASWAAVQAARDFAGGTIGSAERAAAEAAAWEAAEAAAEAAAWEAAGAAAWAAARAAAGAAAWAAARDAEREAQCADMARLVEEYDAEVAP